VYQAILDDLEKEATNQSTIDATAPTF